MKSIILFAAILALLCGVVVAQDPPPPPVQVGGGPGGQRGPGQNGQGRGNRPNPFDFDHVDKNKDGKISKEEITETLAQMAAGLQGQQGGGGQPGGRGGQPGGGGQPGRGGQGPQMQSQMLQGFDTADANHDGFLSREEFGTMMAGFRARGGGQFGAFRFIGMQLIAVLDTNKDNKLSKEEYGHITTEVFDKLDKDKDDFLSVEEAQSIISVGGVRQGFPGGPRPDGQGGQGRGRGNGQGGQQGRGDGQGGQPGRTDGQGGQGPGQGQPGRARINYNLEELDKNKDGKVTPDEWIGSPDVFRNFDTNKDGFLTKDELEAASKRAAQNARRIGEQMVQVLDTNNDNKISREEFGKLVDLFDKMDKKNEGQLTADELSPLMTLANEARIQSTAGIDIDQLIRKYDKNGDSKLSADEMADGANGPKLFKALDANKDGFVTREEIVTWVTAVAAKKAKTAAGAPAQSPKP